MATLPNAFPQLRRLLYQEPPPRPGYPVGRWRLADLAAALPALAGYSLSGLSRWVRRAGLRLKRGRLRVHSPDPAYLAKEARIAHAHALAQRYPQRLLLLYGDEASVHRQPTLAPTGYPVGAEPTATRSHRANTQHRICAGLNASTGQVTFITGSQITVANLRRFLRTVREAYPEQYLLLVWDNWPVHTHPAVRAEAARLHIHLLWLPTYAPWLNPIEKLWRWLKQEVVHGHRLADKWEDLKTAIAAFLQRFSDAAPDLLRYTGLCTD